MSRPVDLAADAAWPIAYIEPAGDGSWQPAPPGAGLLAALLALEEPGGGELIDICGWELGGGGSPWWLRTGAVGWLGPRWLDRCRRVDRPLRIVGTPKAWLRDRGEAVCIVDWNIDLLALLGGLRVAPESPALERLIRRKLAEQRRDAVQFVGAA